MKTRMINTAYFNEFDCRQYFLIFLQIQLFYFWQKRYQYNTIYKTKSFISLWRPPAHNTKQS